VHRVVSAPGEQVQSNWFSFAYVVKPSNRISMRKLVSGEENRVKDDECSYKEWHLAKNRATGEGKSRVIIGSGLANGKWVCILLLDDLTGYGVALYPFTGEFWKLRQPNYFR
jgi:hypothetical protein